MKTDANKNLIREERCACDGTAGGRRAAAVFLHRTRAAEIGDEDDVVTAKEVLGLDVEMEHATLMCEGEAIGETRENHEPVVCRHLFL